MKQPFPHKTKDQWLQASGYDANSQPRFTYGKYQVDALCTDAPLILLDPLPQPTSLTVGDCSLQKGDLDLNLKPDQKLIIPADDGVISAVGTDNYLGMIAAIRAIRKATGNQVKVKIAVDHDQDTYHKYLSALYQAHAAMSANATEIVFPDLGQRLTEGMINILQHEAQLNHQDPFHGSFLVETLTAEILNENGFTITDPPGHSGNEIPGQPPFTRGPYSTMYVGRPWTIRQYAGFSTAAESNQFYKDNLAAGQKGLSVAFDLPTHRGYDSDHPRIKGDVGMAGVAIDTIKGMARLFEGVPLDQVSVSMTMNGAVLPIMAFFLVVAEESGVDWKDLRGTIQNDILKEFMVRNTYIYPPEPSMRIATDVMEFLAQHAPKFNGISVSGYHMLEAGADPALEIAYTLCDGLTYLRKAVVRGLDANNIAGKMSFFWGIGMDHYTEVAKLRAGRQLWAELLKEEGVTMNKAMALRTHCQTSGWSLTAQHPFNNIARTGCEAISAVFGGTQSLHTNSLDEAIALPTPFSAAIARNTQLFLQHNSAITSAIDPLGGSLLIESLTNELVKNAKTLIDEIESSGGMEAAIRAGLPKKRIEQQAARRQAALDSGQEIRIGVNLFHEQTSDFPEILRVNQAQVLENQLNRFAQNNSIRNLDEVQISLKRIESAAKRSDNLLAACVDAARARATLGEISMALENAFGRFTMKAGIASGVYDSSMQQDKTYQQACDTVTKYRTTQDRPPHVLLAKLGQDGHDRGVHVVAAGLTDMGFKVTLGPMFATPEEVIQVAKDVQPDVIGISSMTGAHNALTPELIRLMHEHKLDDVTLSLGGIIPPQDYAALYEKGVDLIFGPGTKIQDCAIQLIDKIS